MSEATYFRGYARISLDALYFDHKIARQKHRSTSSDNVKRLLGLYRSLGCENDNYANAVKARISEESLGEALEELRISDLPREPSHPGSELPLLNVARVHCLHGLHRILAAKKHFKDDEKRWWVVQLYKQDLPEKLAIRIIGDYAHEQKEADGETFRQIRLCIPDSAESDRWWEKLSRTKRKELKQVLQIPGFARAFDAIREIEGLWAKFELGTFHKWLGSGCEEEILCALGNLVRVWNEEIFEGVDEDVKSYADAETVDALEGLAPASDDDDLNTIQGKMHSKKIFPKLQDPHMRERLLENISRQRFMIPTLHSISESLKQLEPAFETMKRLCGGKPQGTIRQTLFSLYNAMPDAPIECGDNYLCTGTWRSADAQKYFLYVQLWNISIRNSLYMGPFTPLKERGQKKPEIRRANPALEHRFGDMAVRSGFATAVALNWKERDPKRALAEHFREDIDIGLGDANDTIIAKLTTAMETARPNPVAAQKMQFYSDDIYGIERRNGRPYDNDYHDDRKTFFLVPFLQHFTLNRPKPYITSSFARFNLLYTFFLSSMTCWEELLPFDLAQPQRVNEIQMTDVNNESDVNQMESILAIARSDREIAAKLTEENKELAAALAASRAELAREQGQVQRLQDDIVILNSNINSRASEDLSVQALQDIVSDLTSKVAEFTETEARLRKELESEQKSASAARTSESKLREDLASERKTVQDFCDEISKLKTQESHLQAELSAVAATSGNEEEWRLVAEDRLRSLDQENHRLQSESGQLKELIATLERECSEQKDLTAAYLSDVNHAMQQKEEYKTELQDMKKNLAEAENSAETEAGRLRDLISYLEAGIVHLAQKFGTDGQPTGQDLLPWVGSQIDRALNSGQEFENQLRTLDNDAQQRLQAFTTLLQASTASRSHAQGGFDRTFFYIHYRISASEYLTYHFERSGLEPVMAALSSIMNLPSSKSTNASKMKIFTNNLSVITCTTVEYLSEASTKTRAFWIGNRRPTLIYSSTDAEAALESRKRHC